MIFFTELIIELLIVFPIITFFHELGHAFPLLIAHHRVEIKLGNSNKSINFKIGNLHISISLFSFFFGFFRPLTKCSTKHYFLSIIMGPVFSLIMAGCLYVLSTFQFPIILLNLIIFGFYASIYQFIFTIVPINYPKIFGAYYKMPSDGLQILQLIQNKDK